MDVERHAYLVREAVRLEWIKTPIRGRTQQDVADEIIKGDLEMIASGAMSREMVMTLREGFYDRLVRDRKRAA